jgi:hypothetical protein
MRDLGLHPMLVQMAKAEAQQRAAEALTLLSVGRFKESALMTKVALLWTALVIHPFASTLERTAKIMNDLLELERRE